MAEAEETFEYSNMNIRDGGESVWIMCNQESERAKIRNFLLSKEVTLAIESDGKRFFGKFASKAEKDRYKEANKDGGNLFKKNAGDKKATPKGTKKSDEDKAMEDKIEEMIMDGVPLKSVKPL